MLSVEHLLAAQLARPGRSLPEACSPWRVASGELRLANPFGVGCSAFNSSTL